MAAAAILNVQKFEILAIDWLYRPMCIILPNFIKISQKIVEILWFNGFFLMSLKKQFQQSNKVFCN